MLTPQEIERIKNISKIIGNEVADSWKKTADLLPIWKGFSQNICDKSGQVVLCYMIVSLGGNITIQPQDVSRAQGYIPLYKDLLAWADKNLIE